MAEETYGLDDELPEWADELHGVPADDVDDDPDPPAIPDLPPFADLPPFDDPFAGIAFDDPPTGPITISGPGAAVGLLPRGVAKWYSQRPRPFTNCMFAALCTTLSYMGYDVPKSFIKELRDASDVDESKPTSIRHTTKAMRKLMPEAEIRSGKMSDDELRQRLNSGEIAARVMVRNQALPNELRQFTGNFVGGHAIALSKPQAQGAGPNMVRWMDPMGRPPSYDGIDVPYGMFEDALMRADGMVRVTYGTHNAALAGGPGAGPHGGTATMSSHSSTAPPAFDPEAARIITGGRLGEFVRVEQGTPFLNPVTLERTGAKAVETGQFRVAGRTIDGRFLGVWVNTGKIKGARGATLLLVEKSAVGDPFSG